MRDSRDDARHGRRMHGRQAALVCGCLVLAAGCEMTGSGARGGLARFLGLVRPKPPAFCASLSDTAPIMKDDKFTDGGPLFERRTGSDGSSTTHVLWPFFSSSRSADRRAFAFRPFVAVDSRPGLKRVEILWPLATYTRRNEDTTLKIFPLFMHKRRVREGIPGGAARSVDTDWWLFPLLFGGSDAEEGGYLAVFPLGGKVKGQLGKKSISFFMWPLWTKTEDKRYDAVNIMWPMLSYWKGKDQTGRRLWPFFGANRREGKFDRRFFMWPLFSSWKVGLDTKRPGDALFVFPFYGRVRNYLRRDSGEQELYREQTTVLFPFFQRVKQKRLEGDRRRRRDEIHAPWPFLGYEKSDGLVVRKLWPIWGERKSNDLRHRFIMWPLYRRSLVHREDAELRWHSIAFAFSTRLERWVEVDGRRYPPAWPEGYATIPDERIALGIHQPWLTRTLSEGTVRSRRWTQLWPLFHHRRDEHGRVSFQALSLLPNRSRGRAETLWRPFYTLFRYERDREGRKRASILFGLFRHAWKADAPDAPGMRHVNLAGIVNYNRRTGVGKKWSLLGGLIGYERVGDRRAYRFLWAPFGRIPRDVREKYEATSRTATADER